MKKHMAALTGILVLFSSSIFAQSETQQNLFNQLKTSIEKSCQNQDFLNCIGVDEQTCNKVTENQLARISEIINTHAQAIENGDFASMLSEIKTARNTVLEENNIEVEQANTCGKEFLSH